MPFIRFVLFLIGCFCGLPLLAEPVTICYNYSCASQTTVFFSNEDLETVGEPLKGSADAPAEREALAVAVGRLYALAGRQSPISADRGGNRADEGVRGGMDCIDHSQTTDRFLRLIAAHGLLKFHRVVPIVKRTTLVIFEHYSAAVEELANDGHTYVIDSWFVDNGLPAIVLPLEDWLAGAGPDVL